MTEGYGGDYDAEVPAEPTPMPVDCPHCARTVIADPIGFIFYQDDQHRPVERWTLVRCREQGHPMLVRQMLNRARGVHRFNDDRPMRLYPPRDRPLSFDVPERLRQAHEEALTCYHSAAYAATVIMCGRTIETACKMHGVETGSLAFKLETMRAKGFIDGRLLEWAHILRDVRNAAAHADERTVTQLDAADSLAFSDALLEYLYVLNERFTRMKDRRKA